MRFEDRKWTDIVAISMLTAFGTLLVKDIAPSLYKWTVDNLLSEYAITLVLNSDGEKEYAGGVKVSVFRADDEIFVDDGYIEIGESMTFSKIKSSGVYTIQGVHSTGAFQRSFIESIEIKGHATVNWTFPKNWTLTSEDVAQLAQEVEISEASTPNAQDPSWLAIAFAELDVWNGITEDSEFGVERVKSYFSATDYSVKIESGAVPGWSAAFVSSVIAQAGFTPPAGSTRASVWREFGQAIAEPRPGAVAVLAPFGSGSSGHVGFVVEADYEVGRVVLLGGNQANTVKLSSFPLSRVMTFRWPTE